MNNCGTEGQYAVNQGEASSVSYTHLDVYKRQDQLLALFIGHGERLFRVYMLARLERREVVFIVRLRGGQVEDEVDIRVGDDLCARGVGLGDAVLRGFALGNAIALPCAEYITAGIAEVMTE